MPLLRLAASSPRGGGHSWRRPQSCSPPYIRFLVCMAYLASSGFFHKARSPGGSSAGVRNFASEALRKMGATQCDDSAGRHAAQPTGALRLNSDVWPEVTGETNMNPEGGFCGMPTQFLGTVRVGGQSSVPRWVANRENAAPRGRQPYNQHQLCKSQMIMSLQVSWGLC